MSVHPFTPSRESPAALRARTVGGREIVDAVVSALRSAAATASRPHTLLVGPHGSGKSHLIEIAVDEARDPARLAVVRLPEDAYDLSREQDIQRHILATLGPDRVSTADERASAIAEALQGRVLVLIVENLNRVFSDLGLEGQRWLRSWVETDRNVMVLASAPLVFNAVSKRDQPWFGGFATYLLPDLDIAEAQDLVATLAVQRGDEELAAYVRTPQGAARLSAIAELTGSLARVWTLLGLSATARTLDAQDPAVEQVVEALVPHYQRVVAELSPTERLLVTRLALWGPQTVSQLAADSEVDPGTTANTLRRLTRSATVSAHKPSSGDRRQTYYRVRDRLLARHLEHRHPYSTRNPTSGW